jgi:hypothetical protein
MQLPLASAIWFLEVKTSRAEFWRKQAPCHLMQQRVMSDGSEKLLARPVFDKNSYLYIIRRHTTLAALILVDLAPGRHVKRKAEGECCDDRNETELRRKTHKGSFSHTVLVVSYFK